MSSRLLKKNLREDLTPNFKWEEFDSRDGVLVPVCYMNNVLQVAMNLEVIRAYFGGKPLIVNSGYRSLARNKYVGGVPKSFHLKGMAADIYIKGVDVQDLYKGIRHLINSGKITPGGVGLYVHKNFVHYDIQGVFRTWGYDRKGEALSQSELSKISLGHKI